MNISRRNLLWAFGIALIFTACAGSSDPNGEGNSLHFTQGQEPAANANTVAFGPRPCAVRYTVRDAAGTTALGECGVIPQPTVSPGCAVPSGYTAIRTAQDLANIGSSAENLSRNYFLCNDITFGIPFSQIKWPASASFQECAEHNTNCPIPFSGVLDGNNKKLVGLTMTGQNGGLFMTTAAGSVIKNLKILNPQLSVTSGGAFVSSHGGRIENCSLEGLGSIIGQSTGSIGGLVGANWGTIRNSFVAGEIYLARGKPLGGIAGYSGDGKFESVSVRGNVWLDGNAGLGSQPLGGIVGRMDGLGFPVSGGNLITRSFVDLRYTPGSSFDVGIFGLSSVGGLIGEAWQSFKIEESFVHAEIWGGYSVGGLVGHNYSMAEIFDEGPAGTVIQDSRYESGDYGGVYGILGVGGLVGWMEEGTISNSLVTGSVGASTNSVGGLVGIVTFLDNTPQVNHSFFNQDANPNLPDSFGEARTDAELRTLSTFAPAWSISYIGDPAQTTWKIASPDGTYLPRLAWEQPINPSSWPRASLSGLYTAMIAYFAETNGFSLDLNYVGWWPPNVSPYFDTVIIGYGTWPPAGFDLSADRTLELWKSQAGELPGALTYHLQAGPPILEHMSSVPYTGTPAGGSWEAGFWAIVIGNVDGDEGADIWLVTNLDRFPAHVDADM